MFYNTNGDRHHHNRNPKKNPSSPKNKLVEYHAMGWSCNACNRPYRKRGNRVVSTISDHYAEPCCYTKYGSRNGNRRWNHDDRRCSDLGYLGRNHIKNNASIKTGRIKQPLQIFFSFFLKFIYNTCKGT